MTHVNRSATGQHHSPGSATTTADGFAGLVAVSPAKQACHFFQVETGSHHPYRTPVEVLISLGKDQGHLDEASTSVGRLRLFYEKNRHAVFHVKNEATSVAE
jgi:hypothetical protein